MWFPRKTSSRSRGWREMRRESKRSRDETGCGRKWKAASRRNRFQETKNWWTRGKDHRPFFGCRLSDGSGNWNEDGDSNRGVRLFSSQLHCQTTILWDLLSDDDEKVRFYTRLPAYDVLQTVLHNVSEFVVRKSPTLPQFQEFVLTLMKQANAWSCLPLCNFHAIETVLQGYLLLEWWLLMFHKRPQ